MGFFSRRHEFLNASLRIALDLSCLAGVYLLAAVLVLPEGGSLVAYARSGLPYLVAFSTIWILVATDQRLFLSRRSEAMVALLFSVAKAFFTAFLFTVFVIALYMRNDDGSSDLDRTFLFVFGLLALCTLLLFRLLLGLSLWNLRRRGFNSRRILIIGSNARTQKLVDILHANEQYGYHVEGFLEVDPDRRPLLEERGVTYLGPLDELDKILVNRVIDAVYIALPVRSYYEKIQSAAHLCEGVGVPVRFMADLFPLRLATSEMNHVGDIPLLSLSTEPGARPQFALHRAVDMGVSALLLVVLSPVFLLAAALVKLDSPGPVFTTRPRRTPGGSIDLWVFRTTSASTPEGGEPALTRTGQVFRRYGIDELPELINVFRGEISLSGPIAGDGRASKVDSPV
ncbi:MAG: sugar transferase [Candidatus Hydrogenedentes bacterium]|nr:sugar transferase [Candidatus Hydrogenedentota bacterium]